MKRKYHNFYETFIIGRAGHCHIVASTTSGLARDEKFIKWQHFGVDEFVNIENQIKSEVIILQLCTVSYRRKCVSGHACPFQSLVFHNCYRA